MREAAKHGAANNGEEKYEAAKKAEAKNGAVNYRPVKLGAENTHKQGGVNIEQKAKEWRS